MVRHCIAYGCVNRSDKPECSGLSWHSLPINNTKLLRTWLIKLKRTNTRVTKNSYLCSRHFTKECFQKALGGTRVRLKPGSLTTIFSFSEKKPTRKAPLDRSQPAVKSALKSTCKQTRAKLELNETANSNQLDTESSLPGETNEDSDSTAMGEDSKAVEDEVSESTRRKNTLTEQLQAIEMEATRTKEHLERRIAELEIELKQEREARKNLEQKLLENVFNVNNIKENVKLFKFYSGFENYEVFTMVLNFLGREAASYLDYGNKELKGMDLKAKSGPQRALSIEDEFFLVLCRFKVGLLEEDLATRFRISQSLVSKIITTWTKFMYFKLKELKIFPDRDIIELHKPQCFKDKYKGTTVIIDATEVYIEKPTNPEAQQLTFSTYKNSNTLKALIGITPSGSICFVSELYGGSISDKDITLKSGFIEKLERGDEVMADRGFNIQELVAHKGVKVNVPPFMNEAGQFTESELLKTRRIASLRIHVERAIERIKNYHILDFIPVSLCKNGLIDMIFFICAMFTNFLPPLVN